LKIKNLIESVLIEISSERETNAGFFSQKKQ